MLDAETLNYNSNLNTFIRTIELQFELPACNIHFTVFAVSGLVGLILHWNSKKFEKISIRKFYHTALLNTRVLCLKVWIGFARVTTFQKNQF